LIKEGHLYILQTPIFRVRNRKKTIYCYSEEEEQLSKIKTKTGDHRFKGLGEISLMNFSFYWEDIRLDPIMMDTQLSNYCRSTWENTPDRQEFIIKNLKVDLDDWRSNLIKGERVEEFISDRHHRFKMKDEEDDNHSR
jgi:topoisomerase-4 subunit B